MNKLPTLSCAPLHTWETEPEEESLHPFKSLPSIKEAEKQEDLEDLGTAERARRVWAKAGRKVRMIVVLAKACREINCYGASTFEHNKFATYKLNTERQLQRIRLEKKSGLQPKVAKPWYILDPQSFGHKLWNCVMAVLLLYTALLMPYRLAFSEDDTALNWFIVERCVDGLFFIDVVITSFTALELEDGSLEIRLVRILCCYFKSWMVFDVVACVPFSLLESEDQGTTVTSSSYKSLLRMIRLPRLYRLLRITKLYRIVLKGKLAEFLERLQDCLSMNRGVTKLIGFALTVLTCVHISACLWYYLSKLQNFGPDSWTTRSHTQIRSEGSRYIACVYWAVTTLTTVGYGDVVGSTDLERIYSIFWMIFGVVLYGFTIGSLCTIMIRINSKNNELLVKLNAADQMVRESNLSEELKKHMRRALRHHNQRAELESKDKKMMFDSLPKKLRYEVSCAMYGGVVEKIRFFQGRSPEWVSSIIPFLHYSYHDCGEYVYHLGDDSNELYILLTGRADFILGHETIVFKRILEGSYFGDIEMLQRRKRLCSCAMESDGELLVMNRTLLKLIETDFSEVYLEMEALAQKRLVRLLATKNEVEEALEKMEEEQSPFRRKRTSGLERGSDVCLCPMML